MAKLFVKQAQQYLGSRPNYPEELFQFIASKTPCHDLVWDVGTGSGQATSSLARIYKNVVATDTSAKQLELAPKLANVQYKCTTPNMSMSELQQNVVATESSVDLVTIAQAMHWFDLPSFYQQVKWVLKKPNGVIAAWCYTLPLVNRSVDSVFQRFYAVDTNPYWSPERKIVDDMYRSIEFPFEPVNGCDHTGPYEFKSERLIDLEGFFMYVKSWSAYQTAKENGVQLLKDDVVEDFTRAWKEDGQDEKIITFPIYLRIGKVGISIDRSLDSP